ncbi:hypothetical protein MGSAQ_001391, partial [marine sediment metagenome]
KAGIATPCLDGENPNGPVFEQIAKFVYDLLS